MCLCHTVNHTIYIIYATRGVSHVRRCKYACGLLSAKRRCGASDVWTDSLTSCAPSRTRCAARRMDHVEWTHRGDNRGIPGRRTGARDLSGNGQRPPRRGLSRSVRALAPGLPRGPENFELVRVDRSRGRVWARSDIWICRCVALTGISHTRAGLRRKPGRDGSEAKHLLARR